MRLVIRLNLATDRFKCDSACVFHAYNLAFILILPFYSFGLYNFR